jgi:hypothetical protein
MRQLRIWGAVVAIIGFAGAMLGDMYIENNPLESAGSQALKALGEGGEAPFAARAALFFDDYGIYIGIIGLVVMAVGVAVQRGGRG